MFYKARLNIYYFSVFLTVFLLAFSVIFNLEGAQAMISKKDMGTLAAEAELILTGKVTALQSVWEGKKIYTYVTVSTRDSFKGTEEKEVIIKVPGGTVGEITCHVSDTPAFKKGEEILVFLKSRGMYYELAGAQQGKYTIKKDEVMGLNVTVNGIPALISGRIMEEQEVKKGGTEPEPDKTNRQFSSLPQNIVEKGNGPIPEITDISPDFGPAIKKDLTVYDAAEDSTQVAISGINFGSSQGMAAFWAGQGDSEFTYATIKSWSDNQIVCLVPGGANSYYSDRVTGNVFVVTGDGLVSEPALFRVTYSCMGGKVPGNKLTYKVNANTPDYVGEENSVQEAGNAWNNAGANFEFEYSGATHKTSVDLDSENSVVWVNEGNTGWLAQTWIWWYTSDPASILESDIEFNDYYLWSSAASCPSGKRDVQGIAVHELGHSLGLLDLYGTADLEKTMYGNSSPGEIKKRTLEQDDIDGIKYLYGLFVPDSAIEGVVRLEKVNSTDPEQDSPLADNSGTEVRVFQQGSQVKSSLSEKDGSYQVDGLAAGMYDV